MARMLNIQNNINLRLKNFSILTGYPTKNLKYLRKIGPPLHKTTTVPVKGSELFVHRLPPDALEDEIFWFFQTVGDIYEIRLMLRPSGLANRGFAYVRYFNPAQAKNAIDILSKEDFRRNHKLFLEISVENNRLFLSGIPRWKTKDEVMDELYRVGMTNVINVIMYKGYKKDQVNRGFVFLEFNNHESAATTKREYSNLLRLWNRPAILDWAEPLYEANENVMAKVTRVFIRNLDVDLKKAELMVTLRQVLDRNSIAKVYKNMDYSFIHFLNRELAEEGLKKLQEYYRDTDVEVTWSNPQGLGKLTKLPPRMRQKKHKKYKNTILKTTYNNEMNVIFPTTEFQQTFANDYKYDKEEIPQLSSSPLLNEVACNNNSKYTETNGGSWELWKNDIDWFYFYNRNKQIEQYTTHDRAVVKESQEKPMGLRDDFTGHKIGCPMVYQDSSNGFKECCGDLIENAGESYLFRETVNHTLNLRFQLDLYEERGCKHNAT